jgi:release factor glutamine methyltransferase
MKLKHILGRIYFHLAYPLYYRRKLAKSDRVTLLGFSLTVPPGVFHPGLFFSTKILAAYVGSLKLDGLDVLEMGCGSGLVSLVAASQGARVVSADINPAAVECTDLNAAENGFAGRIEVVHSDLFRNLPAGRKFDMILWNPPFYPKNPRDDASFAWNAGEEYCILRRFAVEAPAYLRPGGIILLILTDANVNVRTILGFFTSAGFTSSTVVVRRSVFEEFAVYELRSISD